MTTNWQIISYVQIAFYAVMAIAHLGVLIKLFQVRRNLGSVGKNISAILFNYVVFFSIFVVFKIAGGVCATILFKKAHPSEGLVIATFIFDSISLGILIRSTLPVIEFYFDKRTDVLNGYNPDDYKETRPKKSKLHPFSILTLVVLIAVVLSVVASSSMTDDISTYRSCSKASACLFMVAILGYTLSLIFIISFFRSSTYPHASIAIQQATILLFTSPLFFVRVIWSLLSAFSNSNILLGNPSKYSLLYGDYIYYTFLGFIEECVIGVLIMLSTYYFFKHVDYLRS